MMISKTILENGRMAVCVCTQLEENGDWEMSVVVIGYRTHKISEWHSPVRYATSAEAVEDAQTWLRALV